MSETVFFILLGLIIVASHLFQFLKARKAGIKKFCYPIDRFFVLRMIMAIIFTFASTIHFNHAQEYASLISDAQSRGLIAYLEYEGENHLEWYDLDNPDILFNNRTAQYTDKMNRSHDAERSAKGIAIGCWISVLICGVYFTNKGIMVFVKETSYFCETDEKYIRFISDDHKQRLLLIVRNTPKNSERFKDVIISADTANADPTGKI